MANPFANKRGARQARNLGDVDGMPPPAPTLMRSSGDSGGNGAFSAAGNTINAVHEMH